MEPSKINFEKVGEKKYFSKNSCSNRRCFRNRSFSILFLIKFELKKPLHLIGFSFWLYHGEEVLQNLLREVTQQGYQHHNGIKQIHHGALRATSFFFFSSSI